MILAALPYGGIGLGLTSILFRSFTLQWQPMPVWTPVDLRS